MRRLQRIRLVTMAGVFFTAAAACLWCLALSGARGKSTPAMLCVEAVGAGTASVIAAFCWTVFRQRRLVDERFTRQAEEYERREAVLISAFKLLSGGNPTGPMPTLRAVAGETPDLRSRRG